MKLVTIKELHERTGKLVREAGEQTLVITDHGKKIAVLKNYSDNELETTSFPSRDANLLPKIEVDTTGIISQDREE